MLNGYKYIKSLGFGGFGKVILAREEISGRLVAIKSLNDKKNLAIDNIKHEIQILSRFYHPHIVIYHNTIETPDGLHFVMEYCEGGSLQQRMKEQNLSQSEVIKIILTIAKALKFVHDQNIIHHDIKPANILFDKEGTVKLADFGVANTLGFTKLYLPPIISDFTAFVSDKRHDIYSLGITTIELLNRQHPFTGLSNEQIIKKLKTGDIGISHFPDWLQEIIFTATHINENARFQTIDDFIEAIENNNISYEIDEKLIEAAKLSKRLKWLLSQKKYYTASRELPFYDKSLLKYPILKHQVGLYYLKTNQIPKAKNTFEELRSDHGILKTSKELAIINIELGYYSRAINFLKEHLLTKPDDPEGYNLLLECYFYLKRYNTGSKLCHQLIKTFPKESCFKTNVYLFDRLKSHAPHETDQKYQYTTNKLILFNRDIFRQSHSIINPNKKDNLLKKLIFCHYDLTKNPKYNDTLEISQGGKVINLPPNSIITIGRKDFNNTIELSGLSVSRKHCAIIPLKKETWLYDLNSTGTFIDNQKVQNRVLLTHKHEIDIGQHSLTINVDKNKLF